MEEEQIIFEDIYHKYERKIYNFIFQRVQCVEKAKDLTQEVFIKVYQQLSTFRNESTIATWLYRIATNSSYDYFRRQTSIREKTLSCDIDLEKVSFARDKTVDLSQRLVETEMKECIHNFIKRLPTTYQAVLILKMKGLRNEKIAEIIGCSLGTVKISLHRARQKLKTILTSNCNFSYNEENIMCCESKNK